MKNKTFTLSNITILILVLILFNHSISGQSINNQGFCRVIHDEHAANSFVETIRTPKGTSCDAYYLNVYFHFIRDNAGSTGQPVSNISQYINQCRLLKALQPLISHIVFSFGLFIPGKSSSWS